MSPGLLPPNPPKTNRSGKYGLHRLQAIFQVTEVYLIIKKLS